MDYDSLLRELFSLQRFGVKLGLDNIEELLHGLGDPHRAFPSVHVAGTNGKGSVVAFLDGILRAAGVRTGRYTSPHLVRFNERIVVDGEEVSDEDVVRLYGRVRPIAEAMAAASPAKQPTFFEVTTAMAFEYFRERRVQMAVVEVGLGGRLDATNVLTPELGVITRIGLDHTEHLGKTVERIAAEKAGILKPGVPVVTAAKGAALAVIRKRAKDLGCEVVQVGRDVTFRRKSGGLDGQTVWVRGEDEYRARIGLLGGFQAANVALAVAAAERFRARGWSLSRRAIERGLASARWPARLQVVRRQPLMFVDGTHNPDGARVLRAALRELLPRQRVLLVIGILREKDADGIAAHLAPLADAVIATQAAHERATPAEDVARAFARRGSSVVTIPQVSAAVEKAIANARGRPVLITGSLYVAGEALAFLGSSEERRVETILRRLRERYMPGPFPGDDPTTALARQAFQPFRVLIGTILSQRTRDEKTHEATERLFAKYRTPATLAAAPVEDVERLIRGVGFYRQKAPQIVRVANLIANDFGGRVPEDLDTLLTLPQVGRKTANCVLVYGFGKPAIPVDVHVHRIANRLGLVSTRTEEATERALEEKIPKSQWIEVNELLVRHGQEVCKPQRPWCERCNVTDLCAYYATKVAPSGHPGD